MLEPGRSTLNVCLTCGNAQSQDSDKGCRPFTSASTMGFDASPAAGRTLEAQEDEKLLGLLKGGRDRQDLVESNSACAIKYIVVVLLASSYFVVSSWLIVLNKTILKDLNFSYPIFLSGIGQLFSAVTAFVACKVLGLVEAKHGTVSRRLFLTSIAPVGLFSALTLTCGNWVYMYLTVALIQMLKAATPVFVMLALFLARLDSPTPHLLASVALIVTGSAGASFGDVNLSITGLLLMLAAEAFEAVRMVLMQVLLKGHAFSPLEGQMYFGSAAVVCMGMLWAVLELPRMWASGAWAIIRAHPAYFLCSGTLGFVVSLVSLSIIKQTSSLTIKVLSTSRNAGLVLLSALVLGEKVSRSQVLGYSISLAGFAWYTILRR